MYDLIVQPKENLNPPKAKNSSKKNHGQRASSDKIVWEQNHQDIVNELLEILKSPVIMAYPNFEIPFVVHCDASEIGLGSVLYQKQDEKLKVISYGSRTLSPAEKNYHLHSGKLEFLALKWSLCDKFREYLYYSKPFIVYSDNNPLSYVLTTAKLNATGMRWISNLAQFRFTIKYRPGKASVDCDFLSRISGNFEDYTQEIDLKALTAIFTALSRETDDLINVNAVNSFFTFNKNDVETINLDELKNLQLSDSVVGPFYKSVASNKKLPAKEIKCLLRKTRQLFRYWEKCFINENGILIKSTKEHNQIVLPAKFHNLVYKLLHNDMGHLSHEKVLDLAKRRFYWPSMSDDIKVYTTKRCKCIIDKKPNREQKAPLVNIDSTEPFEIIAIDFLHLDKCKGGYEYVLIVIDHFTRFAQAYATKNKTGKTAANAIFNDFILNFGFPNRIHHDQGGEFNNKMWSALHSLSGIEKSKTTPYHPMGNGQCERMNRTLINMLKTLSEEHKNDWKSHLKQLMFAYNSTVCSSTGFSPHYLMFGRESRLPIDFVFDIEPTKTSDIDFAEKWKKSLKQACEVARKSAQKGKRHFDKKTFGQVLKLNDRVLVRNLSERGGTGKLRSHWEKKVHIVKKCDEKLPIYCVAPEDGSGKERVVHRNLLMKCELLPLEIEPDVSENDRVVSSAKKSKEKHDSKEKKVVEIFDSSSDSDSDIDDALKAYLMKKLLKKRRKSRRGRVDEKKAIKVREKSISVDSEDDKDTEDENESKEEVEENSEDGESTGEESDGESEESLSSWERSESDDEDRYRRPVRERRPPKVLTYDSKGNTYYTHRPMVLHRR